MSAAALPGRKGRGRVLRMFVKAILPMVGVLNLAAPGQSQAQPVAAGVSPEWARVVAAAHKEGKVVVYATPTPPVLARLKADFEKAYPGIALEINRMVGDALILKIETERSSNVDGADVALGGELVWFEKLAKEGAVKPPSGPAAKAWPAEYLIQGVSPTLAVEPFVMVYNTNLIKSEITGYQDLLKPEYKGKIGVFDLLSTSVVAWYDWLEKTQGPEFLPRIAAQSKGIFPGTVTDSVAAGEVPIALFSIKSRAQPLIERGAPMKVVVPKPGFGNSHAAVILASARRPNAALVLMDYFQSVRGQTTWHGNGETASPLPGIPGAMDPKSITIWDAKAYPGNAVNAYRAKWEKIFRAK